MTVVLIVSFARYELIMQSLRKRPPHEEED